MNNYMGVIGEFKKEKENNKTFFTDESSECIKGNRKKHEKT